jgi:serine phosphatase RsbU (regulator of sigma subunit)
MKGIFTVILIFFISIATLFAAKEKPLKISSKELHKKIVLHFTSGWKYKSGDNLSWASSEFNDSSWNEVNTIRNDSFPSNWKGTGWFRFHFTIDTSLFNKSVFLYTWSAGTQEVFLDGKYEADNSTWKKPKVITFNQQQNHLLAVKYINNNSQHYKDAGFSQGFRIGFGSIEEVIKTDLKELRGDSNEQMFFTAITLAFGLLHFILFLYNRRFKENLIYSIFLFVFAASIFADYNASLSVSITEQLFTLRVHRVLMSLAQILILLSLYTILKQKIAVYFWIVLVYYFFAAAAAVIKPVDNFVFLEIGIIIVLLECFRITLKASKEKIEGVWIIAAGFSILFIFSFYDWLLDLDLINRIGNFNNGYPFGTIGLFICMSVFLSKSFAKSNQKIIQQEKLNKAQEIENKYLDAENKRKSLELEDARKLQLSILPKSFPELSHLEISAKMKTAAEVGGDYYDYHLSGDGTITLAIGDATGHGIKAGIMVALIKSLFDAMAHTFFIPDFFNHCTKTIKKMNLGNLYMGMTVLKIQKNRITASAAGMPPFLVYKKSTNSVEDVVLKGMPLGAFNDFQYQQKIFKVEPGDIILLLTDGFVELFNSNREMLDFNMAKNIFLKAVQANSSNIIDDLLNAADEWLNGYRQTDDITFMLIKIKEELK